jgi:hypothetical protein
LWIIKDVLVLVFYFSRHGLIWISPLNNLNSIGDEYRAFKISIIKLPQIGEI